MNILGLTALYKITGSTKRAIPDSGIVGDPVEYLTGVRMTKFVPGDPSGLAGLRETNVIRTIIRVGWIFVDGILDIREGDVMVCDGTEYTVRMAQSFPALNFVGSSDFMRIVCEEGVS